MEIREIHLKHFGKFAGQKLEFHPGVNIIYGENETGKSTACSFIRGMLFGIERSRGRAAKNDEYMLRQPWENPSWFAGSMRFKSGTKNFYLERSFASGEKNATLICEDDGEELDVRNGDLSALLEDISEDTFNNTFYYGNRTGETTQSLSEEIHNYLINASCGHFSQISVTGASEKLRKQRKELETEKKRLIEQTSMAARDLQVKMEYEQQEIDALLEEEENTRKELKLLKQEMERPVVTEQEIWQEEEEELPDRKHLIIGKVAMALLAAAGLGMGFLGDAVPFKIAAVLLIILACVGVRIYSAKDREVLKREQEILYQRKEQERYRKEQQRLREDQYQRTQAGKEERFRMNLEWIIGSREEKQAHLQELREEYEDLAGNNVRKEQLETEIAALSLAEKTMHEVMSETYQEYEDHLNERVSQILSEITGGKYDSILVDEKLNVRIYSGEKVLGLEQVSRGTMEQICFALRMAAGELLNPGDPLPIILDDAFITYDDQRLENTLNWLKESKRQVLIFTCQKREERIINARG